MGKLPSYTSPSQTKDHLHSPDCHSIIGIRRRSLPAKISEENNTLSLKCCGHWFSTIRHYRKHLIEMTNLEDRDHELKLLELGMLRCRECNTWLLAEQLSGHLRKLHGYMKNSKNYDDTMGGCIKGELSFKNLNESTKTAKLGRMFFKIATDENILTSSNKDVISNITASDSSLNSEYVADNNQLNNCHDSLITTKQSSYPKTRKLVDRNVCITKNFNSVTATESGFYKLKTSNKIISSNNKKVVRSFDAQCNKRRQSFSEILKPVTIVMDKSCKNELGTEKKVFKKRGRKPKPKPDATAATGFDSDIVNEFDDVLDLNKIENVPVVELELHTLPSYSDHCNVFLTDPKNPKFKVFASMDAIFVGDSAVSVTNQISYITDSNNVVYVSPEHFLFPNINDLENYMPNTLIALQGIKMASLLQKSVHTSGLNRKATDEISIVQKENYETRLPLQEIQTNGTVKSKSSTSEEKQLMQNECADVKLSKSLSACGVCENYIEKDKDSPTCSKTDYDCKEEIVINSLPSETVIKNEIEETLPNDSSHDKVCTSASDNNLVSNKAKLNSDTVTPVKFSNDIISEDLSSVESMDTASDVSSYDNLEEDRLCEERKFDVFNCNSTFDKDVKCSTQDSSSTDSVIFGAISLENKNKEEDTTAFCSINVNCDERKESNICLNYNSSVIESSLHEENTDAQFSWNSPVYNSSINDDKSLVEEDEEIVFVRMVEEDVEANENGELQSNPCFVEVLDTSESKTCNVENCNIDTCYGDDLSSTMNVVDCKESTLISTCNQKSRKSPSHVESQLLNNIIVNDFVKNEEVISPYKSLGKNLMPLEVEDLALDSQLDLFIKTNVSTQDFSSLNYKSNSINNSDTTTNICSSESQLEASSLITTDMSILESNMKEKFDQAIINGVVPLEIVSSGEKSSQLKSESDMNLIVSPISGENKISHMLLQECDTSVLDNIYSKDLSDQEVINQESLSNEESYSTEKLDNVSVERNYALDNFESSEVHCIYLDDNKKEVLKVGSEGICIIDNFNSLSFNDDGDETIESSRDSSLSCEKINIEHSSNGDTETIGELPLCEVTSNSLQNVQSGSKSALGISSLRGHFKNKLTYKRNKLSKIHLKRILNRHTKALFLKRKSKRKRILCSTPLITSVYPVIDKNPKVDTTDWVSEAESSDNLKENMKQGNIENLPRERKPSVKLIESLQVDSPLACNEKFGQSNKKVSNNKEITDNLLMRSTRERKPSFKLIENVQSSPEKKRTKNLSKESHKLVLKKRIDFDIYEFNVDNEMPIAYKKSPINDFKVYSGPRKMDNDLEDDNVDVSASAIMLSSPLLVTTSSQLGAVPCNSDTSSVSSVSSAMTSPTGREWSNRSAKLKAQILIQEQQSSSALPTSDDIFIDHSAENTSVNSDKFKMYRKGYGLNKTTHSFDDIRSYFPVKKPVFSPSLAAECVDLSVKVKEIKDDEIVIGCFQEKNKNAKRSLSVNNHSKRVKFYNSSKSASDSEVLKLIKLKDQFFEREQELFECPPASSDILTVGKDFMGFDDANMLSDIRCGHLQQMTSLLELSSWFKETLCPLPLDVLCEWDDEKLTGILFGESVTDKTFR